VAKKDTNVYEIRDVAAYTMPAKDGAGANAPHSME